MKYPTRLNCKDLLDLIALVAAALILESSLVRGQERANPPAPIPSTNTTAAFYQPPKTRSLGLKRQIAAGSRHGTHSAVSLTALVPDGLALTSIDQPTLWWFIGAATTNQVEFSLNLGSKTKFKTDLNGPITAGLHRIELATVARHQSLIPGEHYQWAVRLKDGDDPAAHPVSLGWIEFRPATAELKARTGGGNAVRRAAAFAAEGYWYDMVTLLAAPSPAAELGLLLRESGLTNVVLSAP